MKKLFISHATEDKERFVEPLVKELLSRHSVWYDRHSLVAGDSLLHKISEALGEADYGIVVLSPAFFAKKWTRAELDGLFALETTDRKRILPIWLDVDTETVKQYSPIIAGRAAIPGTLSVVEVANEIDRAVRVEDIPRYLTDFIAPSKTPIEDKVVSASEIVGLVGGLLGIVWALFYIFSGELWNNPGNDVARWPLIGRILIFPVLAGFTIYWFTKIMYHIGRAIVVFAFQLLNGIFDWE